MKTTFKPFQIIASFVALLFFSFVISSFASESTGREVSPVTVVALAVGIVGITAVTVNFSRIKKSGAAFATMGNAGIFSMEQLQLKEIVLAAYHSHFGWLQDPATQKWYRPKNGRDLPSFPEEARIIRNDLFHIQYLTPTLDSFKFFNKAQDVAKEFFSNFTDAMATDKEINVFFGLVAELATGAAATDTPDILPFGAAAAGDEEVINGITTYEINRRKELENQVWKTLFVNDDAVKNYLRFPKPIVWEPGSSMELQFKLSKAYAAGTHKFAKFALLGYKITR